MKQDNPYIFRIWVDISKDLKRSSIKINDK